MQNRTFYNFILKLLELEKINASSVSPSVKKSGDFKTLLNCGFIEYTQAITGGGSYIAKDPIALKQYFDDKFPTELRNTYSAIGNIKTFRNTKAGKRLSQNVILIRGFKNIELNGKQIDLEKYTKQFGTFSAKLIELKTEKVCFVENLDSYFLVEQVVAQDFVFIHTYGGLGKSTIQKILADEILIFPDYDYKGLHNYLMVKKIFPYTKLFLPSNYEELFHKFSRSIKTKQGREQSASIQVKESVDFLVQKIRKDIYTHKRFLEQQSIFKND
jgi:hypothetical protein